MSDRTSHLDRFVRSVHRRMVLVRAAERFGVCLLIAAALSLIVMPVLMYRGRDTGPFLLSVIGASALVGAIWAVARRPGRLAAAAEADRQLKLADLIGTAWAIRAAGGHTSEPFVDSVLAQAETRCRAASPAALKLHRLGSRGWGGIGVAVTLAVALHLLGPDSRQSSARASASLSPQPRTWQEIEADRAGNDARSVAALDLRRPRAGGGTDDDPAKSDPPDASSQQGGDATPDKPGAADDPSSKTAQATGGPGGAGSAKSNVKNSGGPAATDPTAGGSPEKSTGKDAPGAGGGGATGDPARAGNAAGNGGATAAATAPKSRRPAPVWRSGDWANDQAAAREAVRSGKVPDAYRDLVREYFDRE
jgi:hypothetical protein